MDGPLLTRVARTLDALLRGWSLAAFEVAGELTYRLRFDGAQRRLPVTLSVRPGGPWCGVAPRAVRQERRPPDAFAAAAGKMLHGLRLEAVRQPRFDRGIEMAFAGGCRLVAELGGPDANLIALDPRGRIAAVARRTKGARRRLREGEPYPARALPAGRVVAHGLSPHQIDGIIEAERDAGRGLEEILRSRFLGLGAEAARLVVEEQARAAGARSAGQVLADRLREVEQGKSDPVLMAPEDPWTAATAGRWDPDRFRLLPWAPEDSAARVWHGGGNPAETVGMFHAAADAAARLQRRLEALVAILDRERRRTEVAARKARADLEGFEDPERFRRWGEALLAGMPTARRVADHALVPDPYDPEGATISVPAAAGLPLAAAADAHFKSHRRARRGREAARRRLEQLAGRARSLEALGARAESLRGIEGVRELETGLREQGIPVEIGTVRRERANSLPGERPRLEGVRMFTSSDGWTILVGRGGRENQRLTFKLAGPEDFWLHALGRPGAHVVLRNPQRVERPPERTLREAAALAAHFSDARGERLAEVQWTRRKLVRKARGAPPGTVLVKRFRTIAVRPGLPLTSRFD